MFVQIGQNGCREHIDPSQQVGRRDHLVEAKLVKELSLISVLPPHHSRISCRFLSRNHCSLGSSTPFSTASVNSGPWRVLGRSPLYPDEQTSASASMRSGSCQEPASMHLFDPVTDLPFDDLIYYPVS